MFNRIPIDQFHQIISTPSSRISSSSSLIPSTPQISTSSNLNFLSFDPLLFPHHHLPSFQAHDDQGKQEQDMINDLDVRLEGVDAMDPWSNDEVIQLLRIKSNSENWFQDLTWDHCSRKLGEIGYKRSAGKCKEKFEEETCRSFSSAIMYNKNNNGYLISEELDEHMYHVDQNNHPHVTVDSPEKVNHQCNTEEEQSSGGGGGGGGGESEVQRHKGNFESDPKEVIVQPTQGNVQVVNQKMTKNTKGQKDNFEDVEGLKGKFEESQGQKGNFEEDPKEVMVQPIHGNVQIMKQEMTKGKKRKRKHNKYEMFKGLCVDIVNKVMAHQEEMHNKLLEEMANREEEKITIEDAWRNEETERVKKEIDIREHEQAMARDRQSTINEFLNKLTFDDQKLQLCFDINYEELLSIMTSATSEIPKIPISNKTTKSPNFTIPKIPFSDKTIENPNLALPKIPFSDKTTKNPNLAKDDDIGKRWPRDEVLALINMRCNVCNGIGGNNEENERYIGNSKGGGSLWERVSQRMLELGYKRSAKRCKEKWENINKYFRKTKDANNKRSSNSRTCPYYHQLSTLYNQRKLLSTSAPMELSQDQPEKVSDE